MDSKDYIIDKCVSDLDHFLDKHARIPAGAIYAAGGIAQGFYNNLHRISYEDNLMVRDVALEKVARKHKINNVDELVIYFWHALSMLIDQAPEEEKNNWSLLEAGESLSDIYAKSFAYAVKKDMDLPSLEIYSSINLKGKDNDSDKAYFKVSANQIDEKEFNKNKED